MQKTKHDAHATPLANDIFQYKILTGVPDCASM